MDWQKLGKDLQKMKDSYDRGRDRPFETLGNTIHDINKSRNKGGCAVIIGMMTAIVGVLALIVKVII